MGGAGDTGVVSSELVLAFRDCKVTTLVQKGFGSSPCHGRVEPGPRRWVSASPFVPRACLGHNLQTRVPCLSLWHGVDCLLLVHRHPCSDDVSLHAPQVANITLEPPEALRGLKVGA